jgi:hypothetical protein
MKFVLGCVAVIGLLLFVSFNMRGEGRAGTGNKLRITVGQPHPWLVLETFSPAGTNVVLSATPQRAESSVNILSSSFAAGLLALYSMMFLHRIGRMERPR